MLELRVLAPAAFALLATWFTIAIWPDVIAATSGSIRYWLARAAPFLLLTIPPLLTLGFVAILPLHLRRAVSAFGVVIFAAFAASYLWSEYERLAPAVAAGLTWRQAWRFLDSVVAVGSIVGLALSAAAVRLSLNPGPNLKRTNKAAFGDADWMPMAQAIRLFPPAGGLVIGEAYRVDRDIVGRTPFNPRDASTWGQGGKAPLLSYAGEFGSGHSLFFAGSGGFKTTSVPATTAVMHAGPIVFLDPSAELAAMVAAHRKRAFMHDVVVLDPRAQRTGFNVLDWILTSPHKEQDIATVAHWLLNDSTRIATDTGSYFQNQAHNLLTGCLAYIMLSPEYDQQRNLRSLRTMIADPEPVIRQKLKEIHATFDNAFVRETLGIFINMTEATFSGVYSTASKDTQWLSFPDYAALVCGGTFKSTDIATGAIDVFINLRTEVLQTYPSVARVIVGALMNGMMQANGRHRERALFLLDEANLLGYMKTLETARDVGRKYGISLALLYQSVGQIKKHFGDDGKEAWFDGVGLISFAAIAGISVAKELSAMCGEITIEVGSRSQSRGIFGPNGAARQTVSISHQRRPLILPHEIIQTMRADEQIIVIKGRPPLRCGRAIFFRRPEICKHLARNRFATSAKPWA